MPRPILHVGKEKTPRELRVGFDGHPPRQVDDDDAARPVVEPEQDVIAVAPAADRDEWHATKKMMRRQLALKLVDEGPPRGPGRWVSGIEPFEVHVRPKEASQVRA